MVTFQREGPQALKLARSLFPLLQDLHIFQRERERIDNYKFSKVNVLGKGAGSFPSFPARRITFLIFSL